MSKDNIETFAVSPKLSSSLVARLRDAFIAYDGSRSQQSPVEGFVATDDANYDVIRTVAREG